MAQSRQHVGSIMGKHLLFDGSISGKSIDRRHRTNETTGTNDRDYLI